MSVNKAILLIIFSLIIFVMINKVYLSPDKAVIEPGDIMLENNIDSKFFSLENMRVMTYNIHHAVTEDGDSRLYELSRIIKKSGAGIIGLNEVDYLMSRSGRISQCEVLAKKLEMNYVFAPTFRKGTGSYGNGLLTIYPIVDTTSHNLPVFPGLEPRNVLEVRLDLNGNQTQAEVIVLITHLSPGNKIRKKQIKWLEEYISQIKKPLILLGDFNDHYVQISGLKTLAKRIETYPAFNPQYAVDQIFFRSLQVKEVYSLDEHISDHLPLMANMSADYN